MPSERDHGELKQLLRQLGHTEEEIAKILDRVNRYEQETQLDSIMESIGSGRLNLNALIKEALED